MLSFTTHFWGDRNTGFDVLYQNMKAGQVSSRELEEYLRESCSVEESYVKLQIKLAKMAANYGNRGSFGPFWQVLRVLSERLSSIHQQLSQSWQELIKDIHKYSIEQQKKHKEVKEKEGTTVEAVQALQHTLISLHRAKETYHARYYEHEKLKRESSSQRDLEKAEAKLKKSNEDYKALLDKYAKVRQDFIDHMTESCKRFQEIEEHHIQQMKDFINVFSKARDNHCSTQAQVQGQFKGGCSDLTVQRLIEMIVQSKATGIDKPGTMEFIEADVSNLTSSTSTLDIKEASAAQDGRLKNPIGGILSIPKIVRGQRKKTRDIIEKDKEHKTDVTKVATHLVDEEGFSIRPDNVQNSRDSCDSSSDNDSDVEKTSRLRVEIKPKADSPATDLEDIKNIVQTFKLHELPTRRTPVNELRSTPRSLDGTPTKPSDDLINLDILAPTQPTNHNQLNTTPLAIGTAPSAKPDSFPSTSSSSSLSSIPQTTAATSDRDSPFSPKVTTIQPPIVPSKVTQSSATTIQPPIVPPKVVQSSATTIQPPIVPPKVTQSSAATIQPPKVVQSSAATIQPPIVPPPVQRAHTRIHQATFAATSRPTGRQTPDVLRLLSSDRSDSTLSLNSIFSVLPNNNSISTPPFHSLGHMSRGPSPLTLAMSDTVPVAVAFSEVVDAVFKGADQKSFKTRILGTMFVSFPGGIMRVFLENPNPPILSFTIKNTSRLENIVAKTPLLIENESSGSEDSKSFSFDMPAIIDHLRKLTDINKNAKYFNVDIIKYQVKANDVSINQLPLKLTSYWKAEPNQYDYRLDYTYQGSSMHPHSMPLSNIQLALQVPSRAINDIKMHSLPPGTWSKENKRVTWKLSDISDMSENGSSGNVKAKFDVSTPDSVSSPQSSPITYPVSTVTFLCEGATMSGLDFELSTSGYRVSLVKKRFSTGTYLSQPVVINTPMPENPSE